MIVEQRTRAYASQRLGFTVTDAPDREGRTTGGKVKTYRARYGHATYVLSENGKRVDVGMTGFAQTAKGIEGTWSCGESWNVEFNGSEERRGEWRFPADMPDEVQAYVIGEAPEWWLA